MDETGDGAAINDLVDDGFLAWNGIWKGQALVARALEHAMREHAGLSLTWGEILSRLAAAPGGQLQMNELARQVFVSKSGISQAVTQLAQRGLVTRQGDPGNLRITYAVLTDDGRQLLQRSTAAFLSAIAENFSRHVTASEARIIAEAMNRVIRAHGEEPDTPGTDEAVSALHRVTGASPSAPAPARSSRT